MLALTALLVYFFFCYIALGQEIEILQDTVIQRLRHLLLIFIRNQLCTILCIGQKSALHKRTDFLRIIQNIVISRLACHLRLCQCPKMLLQNVRKHLGYFILRGIEGLRSLHACIGIGIQMDTDKQIRLILIDQLDALFHILTLAIGSTLACQIIGSISSHGHMCTSILQQLFQLLCYLQIDFLFLCLVAAGTIILPTMC